MKNFFNKLFITLPLFFIALSCNQEDGGGGINIFSVQDDIELGRQMDQTIQDSSGIEILSRTQYPQVYSYLEELKNDILNSDDIRYRDEFEWKITVIQDDNTLNAFAAPGGYIYIYTGLMKYLECGDHFAGVLAHEVAHADRRHSTQQLTKAYGVQYLLDIVLGNNQGAISQVTQGLINLSFTRSDETEADTYSVRYLCEVNNVEADGAAGFFQRLVEQGQTGGSPEFLSTHPDPENRIENIQSTAEERGCNTNQTCSQEYTQIVNNLP